MKKPIQKAPVPQNNNNHSQKSTIKPLEIPVAKRPTRPIVESYLPTKKK